MFKFLKNNSDNLLQIAFRSIKINLHFPRVLKASRKTYMCGLFRVIFPVLVIRAIMCKIREETSTIEQSCKKIIKGGD